MANGHGGARIGAGQKKKALSDKLVEGNPGKRKLTVMEFTDTEKSCWWLRSMSAHGRGSTSGAAPI